MFCNTLHRHVCIIVLFAFSLAGCKSVQRIKTPQVFETPPVLSTSSTSPTSTSQPVLPIFDLSDYVFPHSIGVGNNYLFYLHGKIIEDQGIPAVSPEYGEYEYQEILERFSDFGFVVISEQRPKNTNSVEYAGRIVEQVATLLDAGVPAKNITIVGASKGAGIVIYTSYFLENEEINFVIMAICHPDEVEYLKQHQIFLYGNILSIYDSADHRYAGSCQELFAFSEGKGISRYEEIVLSIGTGHGILYQPLEEWIRPIVQWARRP